MGLKFESQREVWDYVTTRYPDPGRLEWNHIAAHYPHTLPAAAVKFDNVADMRRRVASSGSHYFDRDAVRFFRGRTDGQLYGGRYWVESRQYVSLEGVADPREYFVAWVSDHGDGRMLSVEKLGPIPDLVAARSYARAMALTLESE